MESSKDGSQLKSGHLDYEEYLKEKGITDYTYRIGAWNRPGQGRHTKYEVFAFFDTDDGDQFSLPLSNVLHPGNTANEYIHEKKLKVVKVTYKWFVYLNSIYSYTLMADQGKYLTYIEIIWGNENSPSRISTIHGQDDL